MDRYDILRAWGRILCGWKPFLSIEVTRECPLRCPGCYAYDLQHLGGAVTLRQLSDYKGDALVQGVLSLVQKYRPMHLSIVGGDPLVRYREMDALLPQLEQRGVHVQLVTSAFREIPAEWMTLPHLNVVVSIDGLPAEHDIRRKPATYERILQNIAGRRVTVHCTITAQMLQRPAYLQDFMDFWTPRPETRRVWMSIFTPQVGDALPEILSPDQRRVVVAELLRLAELYPKLDMKPEYIREFADPPRSPNECTFAQTTTTISADLKTLITPCQFGGNPDCSQCGCIASMGLASIGRKEVKGIKIGRVLQWSNRVGEMASSLREWRLNL